MEGGERGFRQLGPYVAYAPFSRACLNEPESRDVLTEATTPLRQAIDGYFDEGCQAVLTHDSHSRVTILPRVGVPTFHRGFIPELERWLDTL